MEGMIPEQGEAVMAAWSEGIWKIGDRLHNVRTPFGPSSSLADDGTSRTATLPTACSIVVADDMAGAHALADGHPYLSEGVGNIAIDIDELMPVPF